jgi:hypothetical protein
MEAIRQTLRESGQTLIANRKFSKIQAAAALLQCQSVVPCYGRRTQGELETRGLTHSLENPLVVKSTRLCSGVDA